MPVNISTCISHRHLSRNVNVKHPSWRSLIFRQDFNKKSASADKKKKHVNLILLRMPIICVIKLNMCTWNIIVSSCRTLLGEGL